MGEPVTLETFYDSLTARMSSEELGAKFYAMSLVEGQIGATRHGAEDRWDWGETARSLLTAQDRWRQAERMVAAMEPAQRAMLWLDGHPERELLRKVARRFGHGQ